MVSKKRHILKTISWRLLGTLDTAAISILITSSWKFGLAISGIEILTKMILYYLHERAWYKYSNYGINKNL
tara:strand:+ start:275 stop:487 length:213 start_codon:yes stop_codon:yes gene_type:complete